MNRLTNTLVEYSYALNASGHRLSEQRTRNNEQRTVSYTYDNLYRLTQETIVGSAIAGTISYTYDPVGNRQTRNSTLGNIVSKVYDYDMNDRLGSDSYDNQGNTVAAAIPHSPSSISATYTYDFENRILLATPEPGAGGSAVQILYDGDGNRVGKTINGITIRYLVDDRNLSGYSQVLAEMTLDLGLWTLDRSYTYGLDLISQDQIRGTNWAVSFYGYDGHGNVRLLTDESGNVTDTYDYDAFGTLIEQKAWDSQAFALVQLGTWNLELETPNLYRYCGEQFDPDLGLYFLRARYMDTDRGRFWTIDSFEGVGSMPLSLHKYLYVAGDPINAIDPLGLWDWAWDVFYKYYGGRNMIGYYSPTGQAGLLPWQIGPQARGKAPWDWLDQAFLSHDQNMAAADIVSSYGWTAYSQAVQDADSQLALDALRASFRRPLPTHQGQAPVVRSLLTVFVFTIAAHPSTRFQANPDQPGRGEFVLFSLRW